MKINLTFFLVFFSFTYAIAQTNNQATSAIQRNYDKQQCSAVGIGIGKDSADAKKLAEQFQNKALKIAKKRGRYIYSNKKGSGACNCVKFKN